MTIFERILLLERKVRDLKKGICCLESNTFDEISVDDRSVYLLQESSPNEIFFDGPKMRDINSKDLTSFYKMPMGNLTNNIDTMTKNSSMTTATIALTGAGFDNVIVASAATPQDSYIRFPFICTLNRAIYRLRVRVDAVGATAPVLGFRNIWPGTTYSNFNNAQYYGYFNLATGAGTVNTASSVYTTPVSSQYNGFAGTVAAGDIVELELEVGYMQQPTRIKISKVSDILTGEVSVVNQIKNDTNDGNWAFINYPSIIMADGTYTILDYEIMSMDGTEPFILLDGDSMAISVRIPYADSLRGKLLNKLPYRTASIAAGTKRQKGDLATLWEVAKFRPKYVVLFRYLDACQGFANPINANYATWVADFAKYIATIKELGCIPIIVYPQTWAVVDPLGTNSAFYETHLLTNFPNELKIKVLTSESFYDSTSLHYAGATNEIIANKIIATLSGVL